MSSRTHELDTAISRVARLLDLAADLAIQNMTRTTRTDASGFGPQRGFFLPEAEAEQLTALLIVACKYAEHQLGKEGAH